MQTKRQQRIAKLERKLEKLECELKELRTFTSEDLEREQLAEDLEKEFEKALPDAEWSVIYSSEPASLRDLIDPTPEEVAWEGGCFLIDADLEGMFLNRGRATVTLRYCLLGTTDLLDRSNGLQPFVDEISEWYPKQLAEIGYKGPREYGRISVF